MQCVPGKHSPCHYNSTSNLNRWQKEPNLGPRIYGVDAKFWSYHLHITVQIKIIQTKWHFPGLQPGKCTHCSIRFMFLTDRRGTRKVVTTFLKSTTLYRSLLRSPLKAHSGYWTEISFSNKECCMACLALYTLARWHWSDLVDQPMVSAQN